MKLIANNGICTIYAKPLELAEMHNYPEEQKRQVDRFMENLHKKYEVVIFETVDDGKALANAK